MYHMITVSILLVALALYAAGFATGAGGLVIVAMAVELAFWYRIIRGRPEDRRPGAPAPS